MKVNFDVFVYASDSANGEVLATTSLSSLAVLSLVLAEVMFFHRAIFLPTALCF